MNFALHGIATSSVNGSTDRSKVLDWDHFPGLPSPVGRLVPSGCMVKDRDWRFLFAAPATPCSVSTSSTASPGACALAAGLPHFITWRFAGMILNSLTIKYQITKRYRFPRDVDFLSDQFQRCRFPFRPISEMSISFQTNFKDVDFLSDLFPRCQFPFRPIPESPSGKGYV